MSVRPAVPKAPASVKPPPPSARKPEVFEEVEAEELLASAPAHLEPIRPVDDEYVDEGPTIALHSPLLGAPATARPSPSSAPRPSSSTPPPVSRRAAPPPSSAGKLPPVPSAPSASRLPPVPTPPPSRQDLAAPSEPMIPPALPPVLTEVEAELKAPVSSKAARASAAASLLAPSGTARSYAPPSVPPSVPRPRSALETIPASRAHSLMPMAASVPPPPVTTAQPKGNTGLVLLAAAAALCVVGALGVAAVKGGSALGIGSPKTGALAVTVAGPGGAKVDGLRVLVDGVVQCDTAPCRLGELSAGTHFISAEAPGFSTTAARAVAVERGAEAALHVDLVPVAPQAAAEQPKILAGGTSLDDLKAESPAAGRTEARPVAQSPAKMERTAKADKPEAKKAADAKADTKNAGATPAIEGGTLNINSIPMANVVLDGRPMGSTPLIGLKVSAGPHSVVFIHPEHGRKASGTTVKAGGSATVAVRF